MAHRFLPLGFYVSIVCLLACAAGDTSQAVRPGIDVLLTDSARLLEGRRIGLLTNHTGIDSEGRGDLERLRDAGAQVTAIFSPEHGYRGVLDRSDIGHGIDSATGIPVYSLYGETREPTAEMMAHIDILLVDLQDIGARPYTYASTMLLAMRACAEAGVPVAVLDRPNPIGGTRVQGPLLDPAHASFVGMLAIPMRHGMTLGELAWLGNRQLDLGTDLTVVPAAGWQRAMWFDETDLPWIRPSPNMPDLESATHYPGTVIFEATNLSVGRGTPVAFQVLGAPWLDPAGVVELAGEQAGVAISDTSVLPVAPPDGKYPGAEIPAVRLRVTDREVYDPVAVAVALLAAIQRHHASELTVRSERLARLIGTADVWQLVLDGAPAREIAARWNRPLATFRGDREATLLYE
jgi:uncharacterized protein YbbC (DUF1343 family)